MELITENLPSAFGLLLGEAVSRLVDEHDESLDKRAAMIRAEAPKFSQADGKLSFEFRIRPNRQPAFLVKLEIAPEEPDDAIEEIFDLTLRAGATCECDACQRSPEMIDGVDRCSSTLAAAWWLHEQFARRSGEQVMMFLSELKADTVAAGKELVSGILKLSEEALTEQTAAGTRLQWRIALLDNQVFAPLTIEPFVQKQKRNAKGWTKGRRSNSFELLRGSGHEAIDSQIAAAVNQISSDLNRDYFHLFQAVDLLVGHPNVAWDNEDATPIQVSRGEIAVTLDPVEIDSLADDDRAGSLATVRESDPSKRRTVFRIGLTVPGIDIDISECELVLGSLYPAQPVVLIAETEGNRLILARLRDRRATRLISYLLRSELEETLIDEETAHQLTMKIGDVGS
ncbi:MAG: ATP-dependent helicase, partial [Planctomycetota bacterium]